MGASSRPLRILVVNAGSSSLKLRVLDEHDELAWSRDLPAVDLAAADVDVPEPILAAARDLGQVDAAAHRIVHGGTEFRAPIVVDPSIVARLDALTALAPLHQPRSLDALRWVSAALPGVPQIACFDTAFHSTLPASAATYAVPQAWRDRWPIRRYGFHGLSHAYIARRSAELLDRPVESLRLVSCHLGAGASLAAVDRGRSVDTTMGFSPLEGLVMATRSGDVDPGLLLWLQQYAGLTAEAVSDGLEHDGGLQGLAGTDDMRAVLAAAASGAEAAVLARDVYLHRLRAGIAAMAAALGGIDALAFTAGVGENAPVIRAGAIEQLGFLGLTVDADRNERAAGDREIGVAGSPVRVLVIVAREDLEMARQVRSALARSGAGG
jgi:acetate kinase